MVPKFLGDEQLRGVLGRVVRRHNLIGIHPLDLVFVGDPPDLPLGSPDSEILIWATKADRMLVSADKKTMPGHLKDHLDAGNHSPGVLIVRLQNRVADVVEFLVAVAYASRSDEWVDTWQYIT
jgi:hypothetical protein